MDCVTDLIDDYHKFVAGMINYKGIFPCPGMSLNGDGQLAIASITSATASFDWFWNQITIEQSVECVFGLDLSTLPGQGTEFDSVFVCAHWTDGMDGKPWHSSFRIGVINYQDEPRIVRDFDFDNEFWTAQFTKYLRPQRPAMRMTVSTAKSA